MKTRSKNKKVKTKSKGKDLKNMVDGCTKRKIDEFRWKVGFGYVER